MKNLLKGIMLIAIAVSFFGCESEPITSYDENSTELRTRDNSVDLITPNCENLFSVAKFVNNSTNSSSFTIYDDRGTMLVSESDLSARRSSDLKMFNSETSIVIFIRSSELTVRRTMKIKSCRLLTFVIDANNQLEFYDDAY